MIRKNFEVT